MSADMKTMIKSYCVNTRTHARARGDTPMPDCFPWTTKMVGNKME